MWGKRGEKETRTKGRQMWKRGISTTGWNWRDREKNSSLLSLLSTLFLSWILLYIIHINFIHINDLFLMSLLSKRSSWSLFLSFGLKSDRKSEEKIGNNCTKKRRRFSLCHASLSAFYTNFHLPINVLLSVSSFSLSLLVIFSILFTLEFMYDISLNLSYMTVTESLSFFPVSLPFIHPTPQALMCAICNSSMTWKEKKESHNALVYDDWFFLLRSGSSKKKEGEDVTFFSFPWTFLFFTHCSFRTLFLLFATGIEICFFLSDSIVSSTMSFLVTRNRNPLEDPLFLHSGIFHRVPIFSSLTIPSPLYCTLSKSLHLLT